MVNKRLAMLVGVIATLVLAFGGTASAHDDDDDDDKGWTVSTFSEGPIDFSIVAGNGPNECPNLPAGVTVKGSAIINHVVKRRIDRRGITHVIDKAEANGVATDNGTTYRYSYDNVVRGVTNILPAPHETTLIGTMQDAFKLKLGNRTVLRNGFFAIATLGSGAPGGLGFYLVPLREFGDPFNFPNGGGRCDPI